MQIGDDRAEVLLSLWGPIGTVLSTCGAVNLMVREYDSSSHGEDRALLRVAARERTSKHRSHPAPDCRHLLNKSQRAREFQRVGRPDWPFRSPPSALPPKPRAPNPRHGSSAGPIGAAEP